MALNPTTTKKLGDWFNTNSTQEDEPTTGTGLLNANSDFDKGSGVFGVQTATTGSTKAPNTPTMLNLGDLDRRTVDPNTETVAGQMNSLLAADSPYIQSARERTSRAANSRGLLNSSIAASAGEEAAINAALPIAQADAGTFSKAGDYNTALLNQGRQYNADAGNQFSLQQMGIDADMKLQQLQSETQKYIAEKNNETSRYNTDMSYKDAADRNRTTMINNIINSTEWSPDRKAALLRAMGESAFADAVHVIADTKKDLVSSAGGGAGNSIGAAASWAPNRSSPR